MASPVATYLDTPGPIAFAHRGASARYPENTMAAFAAAVKLGFRYVETDVHLTRDNVLIAFHDDRLDRVTHHRGRIAETDWADIREARVDGTEPIPLFTDLLDTWPTLRINVDPKTDAAVGPLIDVIREAKAADRVCLGSFSGRRLQKIRRAPDLNICTSMSPMEVLRLRLCSLPGFNVMASRTKQAAACVQVPAYFKGIRVIDPAFISHAHGLGLKVHVWTINDEAEMNRLLDLGVDGIMSDDAELLKRIFVTRGLWWEAEKPASMPP